MAAVLTQEATDRIFRDGITPLEYLVNLMREPKPKRGRGETDGVYDCRVHAWEDRCFQAAKAAAPYIHPRLQSVEYSSTTDDDPANRSIQVTFVDAPPRPE
ncbi:MAG: hypothetical protein IH977_14065 [Nitrospinae bacterium]|nr:hypothetical protein [Nitrospinota bacterium]